MSALDEAARQWFSVGLGAAFVVSILFLVSLNYLKGADFGFVGLLFVLTLVIFVIAFSFLVAASVTDPFIKASVAIVDAFVLFGSKLFAPHFLDYIADTGKPDYVPLSQRRAKHEA